MNISKIIILLIAFTGLTYVSVAQTKFTTAESAAGFTLEIPDYMTVATDLNNEASLQYQNLVKETYLIVIDESKQEFIKAFKEQGIYDENVSTFENFTSAQAGSISGMLTQVTSKNGPVDTKVNGLPAREYEFTGKVEGIDFEISYFILLAEGADKLYTVMAWTMADRKDKYKDDLWKACRSLKEKK